MGARTDYTIGVLGVGDVLGEEPFGERLISWQAALNFLLIFFLDELTENFYNYRLQTS
ncbi:MAG: hypothetical protein QG656_2739 [Candidatus Hydrogenedentes bacterium]|nr:hypothetical protein [Candidatus Hydrogenedentota bacterium]